MPEAKAHAKQFYESDPRCFNPKLQLSLVLAGLGYIDVVFNERFASPTTLPTRLQKMVDMLFLAVQRRVGHGPHRRDSGHRTAAGFCADSPRRRECCCKSMCLRRTFPAMDRFLHRYDASVVPLENYSIPLRRRLPSDGRLRGGRQPALRHR